MSDHKEIINFEGRQVEASLIEMTQNAERWNEYLLEDGTVLRMKLILKKVLRLDGEYDGDGNPVYIMQSTNVSTVTSPAHLRKKHP